MLNEKEIIDIVNAEIPSGPARISSAFESDAEVLRFDSDRVLFSTDEFSAEDLFPLSVPYDLGWNIAAGAVSDIVAAGGVPLYYAHALVVTPQWSKQYLEGFCEGVRDVLVNYDMTFAGGDAGMARDFRCSVSVIGKPSPRPLSRRGASSGDVAYLSGEVGAGNFNAALMVFEGKKELGDMAQARGCRFNLHASHCELIRKYATSCIDTSDGVFNSLNTIARINRVGYAIEKVPYLRGGEQVAARLGLPELLLFLGECGEYELLFTVGDEAEGSFLREALNSGFEFYRIGTITADERQRSMTLEDRVMDLSDLDIRARSFESTDSYLETMVERIRRWHAV